MEVSCCASGGPESSPLASLESVLNWKESDVDPCCSNSIKLQTRASQGDSKWRCLVCHDMKDGYLHDRFVQGCRDWNAYRFFHWSCIDVFVYFSHKFVTIPPTTWIDAAHLHGVKILGTIITEWTDGKECCEGFLDTQEDVRRFVDNLVAIAVRFDLDGWLVNVENEIAQDKIDNLKDFLRRLTDRLHRTKEGSLVLWYDSVKEDGELDWQNQLNPCNKCFFDCCDGIYLNYNWKEEELEKSVELAGERVHDVYAGIDVFGRGTLGGGGFNTKEPLELIRSFDLSVAIFAPGWVYEVLGEKEFINKEYEFWSLLLDHLPLNGPCSLPFGTSFCQGFGKQFFHSGLVVESSPWHNLSLQQYQPTISKQAINSRIHVDEAFEGGGCLRLDGEGDNRRFNLFSCSFSIREPVYVSFVWKEKSSVDLDLSLALVDCEGNSEVIESESDVAKAVRKEINGWQCRTYLINNEKPLDIKSVEIIAKINSVVSYDVLLGYFQLIPESFLDTLCDPMPIRLLDLVCGGSEQDISALLTWQPSDRLALFLPTFAIFTRSMDSTDFHYLASTRKNTFRLCGIRFPRGRRRFLVQPRIFELQPKPIESCPHLDVAF